MEKPIKSEAIRFRLDKDLKESFFAACEEGGYSLSMLIRILIIKWLKENEKK